MKCVCCRSPMITLELDMVEIDYCLECGGIWLDSGELEMLVTDVSRVKDALISGVHGKAIRRGTRKCPICRKRMDLQIIGGTSATEIDHCPAGHGIWFDKGELEKVVESLDKNDQRRLAQLLQNMFQGERHKTKG